MYQRSLGLSNSDKLYDGFPINLLFTCIAIKQPSGQMLTKNMFKSCSVGLLEQGLTEHHSGDSFTMKNKFGTNMKYLTVWSIKLNQF